MTIYGFVKQNDVPALTADLEQLQQEMAPRPALYPTVTVVLPELVSYDLLLAAA